MNEIRSIPFAPGYLVSNDGRIFSEKFGKQRELKPWINGKSGYLRITFRCNGRSLKEYVHRVVAIVFIGPPPSDLHEVRHIDGNPSNNKVNNIAWGTHIENMQDMLLHGTHGAYRHPERLARGERHGTRTKPHRVPRGERCGNAKITEQQVRDLRAIFAETKNISASARSVGIPRGAASLVLHGKTWKHVT